MSFLYTIWILIISVLSIASTSIAIQAYNDNPGYNPYGNGETRKNNLIFTWVNIGLLCLTILLAIFGYYIESQTSMYIPNYS